MMFSPRHYSGATEEDLLCPGCGAVSLRAIDIERDGIRPIPALVCVNEMCEWVGRVETFTPVFRDLAREHAKKELGR